VTAPTGCAWTGVSNDTSWLTITGAANGSGNGSVSYTATANPNASQRVGTLTIGGQAFTVTQAPAGCSFSISPNSQSPAAAATTGSTTVTTGAGCQWTATSNASWITFGGASSGTGSGPLSFNIAANPNGTQRIGTLTIAGQTYTVTQAAAACTFSISPSTSTVTSAGGSGSSTITATPGCSWTAASNVAWISVTSGASGTGNGSTAFSVASYTGTTDRTGTLTIAGRTFTVTQSSTCVFTLVPDSRQANKNGDTGIVSVSVGTGCTWTPSTTFAWISVTGGATGSGQVNYTIEPNATAIQRTGTIAIGNKTFTITQVGGASPTSPRALKILTAGGGN
jgi:hypothetical protein